MDITQEIENLEGLGEALKALHAQQKNCGFVLTDSDEQNDSESIHHSSPSDGGVVFEFLWLPVREHRGDVAYLQKRGILTQCDQSQLININNGKACFLCKDNITVQMPKEVLYPISSGGYEYLAGAQFAYLGPNHFTIMNSTHVQQVWRKPVIEFMLEFTMNAPEFRITWNGYGAGASILYHEHMQATTCEFPIERIKLSSANQVFGSNSQSSVFAPDYPTPVWVVQGQDRHDVAEAVHRLVSSWHSRNPDQHSENVLAYCGDRQMLTACVFPRTSTKRTHPLIRKGGVAIFEVAGRIVFSNPEERANFDLGLDLLRSRAEDLLGAVAPDDTDMEFEAALSG